MTTDRAIERIKKYEGCKPGPYKDPKDIWTIGFGRNLEDNGLSAEEIVALWKRIKFTHPKTEWFELLLKNDLGWVEEELKTCFVFYPTLPDNVQLVYIDMAYNMGTRALLEFKKMHRAVDNEDWDEGAAQLLWSNYLFDTKRRAVENAKLMCNDWTKTKRRVSDLSQPHFRVVVEYDRN